MSDYEGSITDDDFPLFSAVNRACVIAESTKPSSEECSRKRREILAELKRGDISCVDVETRWHRGQATIGELRERGHIIHTVRGIYKYRGFTPDMVKSKPLQNQYYQTAHWRQMARKRKEYDGNKCVQCGCAEDLETHHWQYDLFNEEITDLCTLCVICHKWMHECLKGSGVHFPRRIPQEIADRILADGTGDT